MRNMLFAGFPVRQAQWEEYSNITKGVQETVDGLHVLAGHIHVMVMHTTCALALQEDEPCLINDLYARLHAFAPLEGYYTHDDLQKRTVNLDPARKERKNGYAHLRALWLNKQELTIPVQDGKLLLGQWQQILLFDFDTNERIQSRDVKVSVIGNPVLMVSSDAASGKPQPREWEIG